jgi:hypothetical protein
MLSDYLLLTLVFRYDYDSTTNDDNNDTTDDKRRQQVRQTVKCGRNDDDDSPGNATGIAWAFGMFFFMLFDYILF